MKLSVMSLVTLLAGLGVASPIELSGTVQKRAVNGYDGYECGSHAYAGADVSAVYQNAIALSSSGQTYAAPTRNNRNRAYPAYFGNAEGISLPGCAGLTKPFLEFPIKRDGSQFMANQSPSTDRIVYKKIASGSYQFCGVSTHEGAANTNGFVTCAT